MVAKEHSHHNLWGLGQAPVDFFPVSPSVESLHVVHRIFWLYVQPLSKRNVFRLQFNCVTYGRLMNSSISQSISVTFRNQPERWSQCACVTLPVSSWNAAQTKVMNSWFLIRIIPTTSWFDSSDHTSLFPLCDVMKQLIWCSSNFTLKNIILTLSKYIF